MKKKTGCLAHLALCLTLLAVFLPGIVTAAPERRTALVIGNSAYGSRPLKNPANDAAAVSSQLQELGFTVILKRNANLRAMKDALADFGNRLKQGGIGLFYYSGHGLHIGGVNYLVPVEERINQASDFMHETLDMGKVINEMANANNGLNVVILDACRDNPYYPGFRNVARGLSRVSEIPAGMFIAYSTWTNRMVKDEDRDGEISPYTKALLENISKPGLTINEIFAKVRGKLIKETGQMPWELSSLDRNFFFIPDSPVTAAAIPASKTTYDLEDANRKAEAEERRIAEERASFEKKKMPEVNRQITAVETERLTAEQGRASQEEARRLEAAKVSPEEERLKKAEEEERASFVKTIELEVLRQIAAAETERLRAEWARALKEEARRLEAAKASLEEERRQTAEERERLTAAEAREGPAAEAREKAKKSAVLALAKPPSPPAVRETARDGRFIAYRDGTVLDTSTNLMWAAKDNGRDIKWAKAKSYCESYRGGGYKDWRMPTQDELAGLYDSDKSYRSMCGDVKLTKLIRLTCGAPWASETRGSDAALFYFYYGSRTWVRQSYGRSARALPVRSLK